MYSKLMGLAVLATATALMASSCAPNYGRSRTGKVRSAGIYHPGYADDLDGYDDFDDIGDDEPLPEWEGDDGLEPEIPFEPSLPPYIHEVRGVGDEEITIDGVTAGTKLRVKFTPGVQDSAIEGTNFFPAYAHLGVYVTVGEQTQMTAMLSNGLRTPQESSVLDFSGAVRRICGGDPDCREEIQITISKPNNDYWCINFGQYCPWARVHFSHPWNATLTIETDDTATLESLEE